MSLLARTAAIVMLSSLAFAAAAEYPERPVRLVIPFPAGGASDQAARAYGDALAKLLGQPLVFENKAGANGLIAAQFVHGAAPDGHTLLWGVASMTGTPVLQRNPPFASMSEFTPVVLVGRLGTGLFVHPDVPAQTLEELVRIAREKPDSLNYAAANFGEHMTTWKFMSAAGISMLRVPYKGGAQAIPDLLAGRVQVYVTPLSNGLPHVQSGKLRLLATISTERTPQTPGVPTFAESGYPGVTYPSWQAVFGPPLMAQAIAERLARDSTRVVADPAVRAQLARQVVAPGGDTLQILAAVVRDDERQWQSFVRENGIVPE